MSTRSETVCFVRCDYPGCVTEVRQDGHGRPEGWATGDWADGCPEHREFVEAHRLRITASQTSKRRQVLTGHCMCDGRYLGWDDQYDAIRRAYWLPHVRSVVESSAA